MRLKRTKLAIFALVLLLLAVVGLAPAAQQRFASDEGSEPATAAPGIPAVTLGPTNHPVVSRDLFSVWLAPQDAPTGSGRAAPLAQVAAALKLVDEQSYSAALPLLSRLKNQQGPLGDYVAYYTAFAQQALGRCGEARDGFRALQQRSIVGYLSEAAAQGEAECAVESGDYPGAVAIYERMTERKTSAPDETWIRLGNAAKAAGDTKKAAQAFAHVYFEFPVGPWAQAAEVEYKLLGSSLSGASRLELELKRAERLFASGRYAAARSAFSGLASRTEGDNRELIRLRVAQCDYHLKQARAAREGLRPLIIRGPRQGEASYYDALALQRLGDQGSYVKSLRLVADQFPGERWAEEALDKLATHYILADDDEQADVVFRELYRRYPNSTFSERAAWKVGWRAFRLGRHKEVIPVFEAAAASFPRSNYRPAWLYWSARSYELLGNHQLADDRYFLTAVDYLNSYYGRLAIKGLNGRIPPGRVMADQAAQPAASPANEAAVRALLSVARYDDALNELRYAQRTWGDSAPVTATMSWIYRQQGLTESGTDQFNLLRGSITLMRRAYPQFMAAGGEELPREVLLHIFPLQYWDLIRKHAASRNLDEYLVAALVAQESTFVPQIRSSAGAVGLMQLMPATGRAYARKLKLPYSRQLLTNPEANIRMGTTYLADKMKEFGAVHLALASYNAGETPVRRWIAERPDVDDPSEFIEDIPYAETQNYVKRILGTAEDYRRLYGPASQRSQWTPEPFHPERVPGDGP